MSWPDTLADHLDRGGPVRWCDDCVRPHATTLVGYRRPDGTEVITAAKVDASIARMQAILDGRRPDDCACRCCAPITARNDQMMAGVKGLESGLGRA